MAIVAAAPNGLALDLDTPLTDALLDSLEGVTLPVAGVQEPIRGFARYLSLHSPEAVSDATAAEIARVTRRGYGLWLVQHVLNVGWVASAQLGADLGGAARENGLKVGYLEGGHVAIDVEGTASSGQAVLDFINAWAAEMVKSFPACDYKGYDSGLTPLQHYEGTPNVHLFWTAPGQTVAVRGAAIHQGQTVTIKGTQYDPDVIGSDALGGRLIWMVEPEAVAERFKDVA